MSSSNSSQFDYLDYRDREAWLRTRTWELGDCGRLDLDHELGFEEPHHAQQSGDRLATVGRVGRLPGEIQHPLGTGDLYPVVEVEILEPWRRVDLVAVGGGFGGMFTAANLRKAGIDDSQIVEKAGDFGGT